MSADLCFWLSLVCVVLNVVAFLAVPSGFTLGMAAYCAVLAVVFYFVGDQP